MKTGRLPMTIILRPEQESVLLDAISFGLAHDADEALDQALDALSERLPRVHPEHPANPWRLPPGGWRPLENGMGFPSAG
jgi:hypothetical protein